MSKPRGKVRYHSAVRELRAAATRDAIIKTARQLFAVRGYARTTMEAVAREAGVSVETVYKRFGRKGLLLRAVVSALVASVEAPGRYRAAAVTAEPTEQLAVVAHIVSDLWERGWDVIELVRKADPEPEAVVIWRGREATRRQRQAPIIRSLAARKALARDLRPSEAADILWALTGPALYGMIVVDRGWTPKRYRRWLADHLARTLLAPKRKGPA